MQIPGDVRLNGIESGGTEFLKTIPPERRVDPEVVERSTDDPEVKSIKPVKPW